MVDGSTWHTFRTRTRGRLVPGICDPAVTRRARDDPTNPGRRLRASTLPTRLASGAAPTSPQGGEKVVRLGQGVPRSQACSLRALPRAIDMVEHRRLGAAGVAAPDCIKN